MAKKRKYPFRPPLKRNQYEAIGLVTTQWAYLETEIDKTILFILGVMSHERRKVEEHETNLIRPFKTRANQLKDLYSDIFDDPGQIKHAQKLIDRALNLKPRRDHIVHGHWHFKITGEGQKTSNDIKATSERFSNKPTEKTMDFPTPKLRDLASKISTLNRDLIAFNLIWVKGKQVSSPGEYLILSG